jgi:hypothetical protein
MSNLQSTSAIGEFRLFPEVEFTPVTVTVPNATLLATDWSFALAAITTSQPTAYNSNAFDDVFLKSLGFHVSSAPNELDHYVRLEDANQYVIGIDTIYLKNGPPTDPNQLKITKIEQCRNNRDLVVDFVLTIKNIGEEPTRKIQIHLNPLNDHFTFCRFGSIKIDDIQLELPNNGWAPCTGTLQIPEHGFSMRLLPGKTGEIRFSMIVKGLRLDSLLTLIKTHPVAGGDVQFLETDEVVKFVNEQGYDPDGIPGPDTFCENCCDCGPKKLCFTWWLKAAIALSSLLVVLLVARRFRIGVGN